MYSQITVANVTLPKAVLSTVDLFAVYIYWNIEKNHSNFLIKYRTRAIKGRALYSKIIFLTLRSLHKKLIKSVF